MNLEPRKDTRSPLATQQGTHIALVARGCKPQSGGTSMERARREDKAGPRPTSAGVPDEIPTLVCCPCTYLCVRLKRFDSSKPSLQRRATRARHSSSIIMTKILTTTEHPFSELHVNSKKLRIAIWYVQNVRKAKSPCLSQLSELRSLPC